LAACHTKATFWVSPIRHHHPPPLLLPPNSAHMSHDPATGHCCSGQPPVGKHLLVVLGHYTPSKVECAACKVQFVTHNCKSHQHSLLLPCSLFPQAHAWRGHAEDAHAQPRVPVERAAGAGHVGAGRGGHGAVVAAILSSSWVIHGRLLIEDELSCSVSHMGWLQAEL
jgi:hypothetical protein